MNEPWAIESILNGTGGGGGGGNPIPPITNVYVPVESWKYQDRIIDVVGFPWVADVPYPNVKASDFVSVIFGQEDAESGIFSNVCESRTDAVRIFASEKPTKRIRIDTLSGFRPNASNSIWGHITGDILEQNDLVDFVGDSNKIETIKANGTELEITDKAVDIPLATVSRAGLNFAYSSSRTVFVSPDGDDITGDGTEAKPWREIQTAITKTASEPNQVITIQCAGGDYNTKIDVPKTNQKHIILGCAADVTLNRSITVRSGKMSISKLVAKATFNIVTSESYGIVIYGGVEFSTTNIDNFNVTAAERGIRLIGEYTGTSPSGAKPCFYAERSVNITVTGTEINRGIDCQFISEVAITNLTVTGSGSGSALYLANGPSRALIYNLSTNLTQYSIGNGSVLAISGKWVNQA